MALVMSHEFSLAPDHYQSSLADWQDHRFALASVLLSIVIHTGSLAVAMYLGLWVPRGVASSEGDEFRTVGLHLADDNADSTPAAGGSNGTAASDEQPSDATAASSSNVSPTDDIKPLSDSPPVPLDLPQPIVGVIGPGPRRDSLDPAMSSLMSLPGKSTTGSTGSKRGTGTGAGTGTGGKIGFGAVSFFGKQAAGNRILYVLDASGSMSTNNAIGVAKAEVKASLQRLDSTQQFQIVFYNVAPHAMTVRGSNDMLFYGNDPNRLLAHRFIDEILPDSGTNHIEALRLALRLAPDVIFFLTDADEPRLTAVELEEVRKRNGGKAQIHTIEFGRGADLGLDNFLKKLARQNGGTHTYRDVTRFARE